MRKAYATGRINQVGARGQEGGTGGDRRSLTRSPARAREKPGTGAGRAPRRRRGRKPTSAGGGAGGTGGVLGLERVEPRRLTHTHTPRGRGAAEATGGRGGARGPRPTDTQHPPADGADPERRRAREREPGPAGEKGPAPAGRSRRDRASSERAPTGQGSRRAGARPGHTPPRRARSWARGLGVGTRWHQGTPNVTQGGESHPLPHPCPGRPAPTHTQRRQPHQVHDATARRNRPRHTRGAQGAHARAPPPPRSRRRHRGGRSRGGATTPPPPSTPTSQRATPPPPGAARHAEGEGRNPPLNPQDTVSPRGGETQQGHGDPGREADEKESQRDGPGPPGRRRKARQRATGEGQGHPRDDGADGRGLATRPAGPVARQSTHPHHRTRDLTASAPQGQGRSRGMGRRHPTRPTRGLRASATSTRHVSSRGESHRPPPPPSVTDRPQPHKAPAGTQARGKPSKSPPSPGGGSGQPSPQRQRGGVGAAPGPPTEGEAPEARGRGRRGSTPGHESRARQGNGHGIPPPHARAVPRRPGTPEPASGDPPRLLPRAPESPAAGAPPRDVANTRTHRTALTRHLPPIQPSGSPFPGSTGTPRERAPGVTTRPRGKRGPNTRADRRPTTASRSPGWRAGEAESRPLAPQPPGTRRTDHTRPHRQGNTTERRNTEGARTHGHTRAGPQHERATDRQPGPAGPSPNTEGGGAGRGR